MTNQVKAALQDAVEYIKTCPLKGTHIKVELEAQLNRRSGNCMKCYGGIRQCKKKGKHLSCAECDNSAWVTCPTCDGSGIAKDMSERQCESYIRDNVSEDARRALVYYQFYDDHSVDSEFTFTVSLDNAVYIVEFIEAFKKLALHISGGMDVDGAGMHVAILNSTNGCYPEGNRLDYVCLNNFQRNMHKLMPALFFLGSCDYRSRPTYFRMPTVESEKYSAINTDSDVLEYRVFETCYNRPEAIFDYICVIANSLRYYAESVEDVPLSYPRLRIDEGYGLHRIFQYKENLIALNKSIKYLKPSYKTIRQLKKERNFTVTHQKVAEIHSRRVNKAVQGYADYIKSHEENLVRSTKDAKRWLLNERVDITDENIRELLRQWGASTRPKSLRDYVISKVKVKSEATIGGC
jgi:hypothetical protein